MHRMHVSRMNTFRVFLSNVSRRRRKRRDPYSLTVVLLTCEVVAALIYEVVTAGISSTIPTSASFSTSSSSRPAPPEQAPTTLAPPTKQEDLVLAPTAEGAALCKRALGRLRVAATTDLDQPQRREQPAPEAICPRLRAIRVTCLGLGRRQREEAEAKRRCG